MKLHLFLCALSTHILSMHAILPHHIIVIAYLYDATLKKEISSYSHHYYINDDGTARPGITMKTSHENTQYTASLKLNRINEDPLKASLFLSLSKEGSLQFEQNLDVYILEASSTKGITQQYTDCAAQHKQLSLTIRTIMGAPNHGSEKPPLNL